MGKKLLVIGATGNQGRGVIRHCLAAGHSPYAFTRTPDSPAARKLQDEHGGVPLVQGDVDDVDSLRRAMAGMDAVFYTIMPAGLNAEQRQGGNVVAAARAAGSSVTTLVYSGASGADRCERFDGWGPQHPMYEYWLGKRANEALVRASGLPHWTLVRPAMFYQVLEPPIGRFLFPELATEGRLRVGFRPDTRVELVDGGDVGLAVAAALSRPDDLDGRTVELCAARLTAVELADAVARATGRAVAAEHVDVDVLAAERGERLVAAQRLMNQLQFVDEGVPAGGPYELTSVEDFFAARSKTTG
ncbi:hypothetical protein GGR56DRAFT_685765 [Xylariaceae sp. FL0804]|nr:hypothetical protein GGR56DRAFT_685765 [Xylariaceae sp. FL0804]